MNVIIINPVALPENPSRAFGACFDCGHASGPPAGSGNELLRCDCGSLLARYVGGGVELKCRRCKRTVVVPVSVASEESPGS
jgi:hypothetical protein